MSNVKKIGITQRVVYIAEIDERRDVLDQRWYDFAENVGIELVPIPNNITDSSAYAESLNLEGLIFSGGNNVGILGDDFREDKMLEHDDVALERDQTEKKLIEWTLNNGKQLIGVCRGLQFINAFFRGKQTEVIADTHVATDHEVDIIDDGWRKMYGRSASVNSYHRWGITKNLLGDDLVATAVFDDHVEGLQHQKAAIYGMMWHPERYKKFRNEDIQFFKQKLGVA